ncbi:AraC family transcriptional regulator [Paenibacillus sp. MBLB4367]|uniref:AraC family transcriptional regulator n=1 Tax=Paenibacillus sp. MBLB4367 TaxID=3384767 RepID=UPI0039083C4A
MDSNRNEFLKQCLSNMQANVTIAHLTKVSPSWGHMNYVPDIHKFYYILDGESLFKLGGTEYEARAGQLYLLPAGVQQTLTTSASHTCYKYWCHFHASIGDLNPFQIMKLPFMIEVDSDSASVVETMFKDILAHIRRKELVSALKVKSILFDLLHFYMERAEITEVQTKASLTYEKMKAVAAFMNEHLSSELTIEELSSLFHLSPNYFTQQFKEMLGVSPIQYLKRMRLAKAKELLRATDMSITEIAAAVGMELHYFSRLFKSAETFAPKDYRQLYRKRIGK